MIDKKYRGIVYIIISAFCFALMNMFVKLSGDLPTFEKAFFRNFVAFFVALFMMIKDKKDFHFNPKNLPALLLRSGFGVLGIICNFYAIDHLVLSDASILNKMSPFFVILFSFIILKEKLTLPQGLIVVGAFIGAVFVIKPDFSNAEWLPSLLGFIGGMCAGLAYTMVRYLGIRGEKGSFIVLFFSGFSAVVLLPLMIMNFKMFTPFQLFALLMAGVSAAGGQFAITAAYTYSPAKEVSVYDYSQIIFAAGLGFFVFGDVPDLLSVVGYVIIVAMAIVMFAYNNKLWFFGHSDK
ncbi:MAG: DMT family transporter [Ruminococcus sp.]|nr:DMT family transporter [Ruminococcus sp.]